LRDSEGAPGNSHKRDFGGAGLAVRAVASQAVCPPLRGDLRQR
jgi:hypothetical protein